MYRDRREGEKMRRGHCQGENSIESRIRERQWQSEGGKEIEKKEKGTREKNKQMKRESLEKEKNKTLTLKQRRC